MFFQSIGCCKAINRDFYKRLASRALSLKVQNDHAWHPFFLRIDVIKSMRATMTGIEIAHSTILFRLAVSAIEPRLERALEPKEDEPALIR
jgi:hypothetical protein